MNINAINAATSMISRINSNSPMIKSALGELLDAIGVEGLTVEVADEKSACDAVAALGAFIEYTATGKTGRAVSKIEECMCYLQIAAA